MRYETCGGSLVSLCSFGTWRQTVAVVRVDEAYTMLLRRSALAYELNVGFVFTRV